MFLAKLCTVRYTVRTVCEYLIWKGNVAGARKQTIMTLNNVVRLLHWNC